MTRHARKPWFQRWATRRQQRSGVWKPGTLGYSPSLEMQDVGRAIGADIAARNERAYREAMGKVHPALRHDDETPPPSGVTGGGGDR